eukprot:scaffold112272_cov32-Tisochrysis_lutea.AAC.5
MLQDREISPEHVVLRANTHQLVYARGSAPDGVPENEAVPLAGRKEPSEDGKGCGLASTIMAQQARDLPRVKRQVEVVNRCFLQTACPIGLCQVDNLDGRTVGEHGWHGLEG